MNNTIYEKLKKEIMSGNLLPGSILLEKLNYYKNSLMLQIYRMKLLIDKYYWEMVFLTKEKSKIMFGVRL